MLTFNEYLSNVKALSFGKKVGKNVYVLWPDLKEESALLSVHIPVKTATDSGF